MSTTHQNVLAPTLLNPPPPPAVLPVLLEVVALSVPFAIGAAATSAINLGKIAIISRSNDAGALTALSLLQPAFILILGVIEALAVTSQVFSARSKRAWPRRGAWRAAGRLARYGLALFGALAALGYGLGQFVSFGDAASDQMLRQFPPFILSLSAFLVFEIYFGALRGHGRVMRGLIPFLGVVVIDLAATYHLVNVDGWGFSAVLAGNLAGPLAMLPVVVLLLRAETAHADDVPGPALAARLRQLLTVVGVPVFGSIVVGVISAAVVFPVLDSFGQDQVAAFFVVLRFRIACTIPAIAIGSAMAVLVNQAAEDGDGGVPRTRYLLVGVTAMLAAYGVATALLPLWAGPVLDLLVPPGTAALRAATDVMMDRLLVTFFLVAGGAMLQMVLEQLGHGARALLVCFLAEAATCALVLGAVHAGGGLALILHILVGVAAATFAVLLALCGLLLRQMGRSDAV